MVSPSRRFAILTGIVVLVAGAWCTVSLLQEGGAPESRAATTEPAPSDKAEKLERPGLSNLYRVSPDLYRGAQPDPKDVGFAELKKLGIKTIVNLRSLHGESDDVEEAGLQYVRIRFNPLGSPEDDEVLQFLKTVTDKNRTPVFVHCQHGADRTGTMCAAYRVVVQGWSKEAAIQEMKTGGFNFHATYYEAYARYIQNLDVEKMRRGLATRP